MLVALVALTLAAAPIPVVLSHPDGIVLIVQVQDPSGRPIPTATVRSTSEGFDHPVNQENGRWRTRSLLLGDEEHPFTQGDRVDLEVRAPGYLPVRASYEIHQTRNIAEITLAPLAMAARGSRGAEQHVDWDALAEMAPELRGLQLTPAVFAEIAETRGSNASLTAEIAASLSALGAPQADAAVAWANEAMRRAGAELEGPEYVAVMDRMYSVRATSTLAHWQALELESLARDGIDTSIARKRAAEAADDWLDYARAAGTDDTLAIAMCMTAAEEQARCE